jgi:3-oxoacyl-[acyl-carrier-protein] synthase-3
MKQVVRNVKIIGTGSYLPDTIFTNEYLETILPTNSQWIYDNVGIKERRIASKDQTTSDLASIAGKKAIYDAGLNTSDIDLIIVATATPDRKAPSTAAFVHNKLGTVNAAAFDINAICSGFLFAMSTASQYISTGVYTNVLVIGADTFSKITNWEHRNAVFFGDGAGAVVLSSANALEGFLAYRIYTDTTTDMLGFTIPGGGSEIPLDSTNLHEQYFVMNGKAVFNSATRVLPQAINQVLMDTGLSIEEINLMIPHQPSIRILKKTAELVGLPFEKVMTNMEKYANTSGGTIPILLDEVKKAGKIMKGDNILFAAIGSGWTYGAAIIKWG